MSIAEETKTVRGSSLGWMVHRLARSLDMAMDARLVDLDLSVPQFAVMMTVLELDGLSQAEIGQRFAMPAYTISRAIDHLEAKGFVERRPHPTSRRTLTIHATDAGKDLRERLFAIVAEVNAELVAPLSHADQEHFRRLLVDLTQSHWPHTR